MRIGLDDFRKMVPFGQPPDEEAAFIDGVDLSCKLRVNYWYLNIDLRAKLECRILGVVWALIWWIWGGFRPLGPVTTDIRVDSTFN